MNDKTDKEVREHVTGKDVTLMQDGWSNIHCKDKAFILEAVETGTNKETVTYCEDITEKSLKKEQEKYDCIRDR